MTAGMGLPWQNVRKECGQWSLNAYVGSVASTNCINANIQLQSAAYYLAADNTKLFVTSALTGAVNKGLWANAELRG